MPESLPPLERAVRAMMQAVGPDGKSVEQFVSDTLNALATLVAHNPSAAAPALRDATFRAWIADGIGAHVRRTMEGHAVLEGRVVELEVVRGVTVASGPYLPLDPDGPTLYRVKQQEEREQ